MAYEAAIKAGTGALGGGIAGYMENKQNRAALNEQIKQSKQLQDYIGKLSGERISASQAAYSPFTAGMAQNVAKYYDILGTDMTKYDVTEPEEFQFDYQGEIQKQLNPELQAIIDRQNQALEQSAASGGTLFSGATGKAIARSTADVTAKEWEAAANRAQTQQQSKYQQYIDKFNNAMKVNEYNRGNLQSNIGNLGALYGAQAGAFSAQRGEQTAYQNAADTATIQAKAEQGAAEAQKKGLGSPWIAALTGGLSGAAGGLK